MRSLTAEILVEADRVFSVVGTTTGVWEIESGEAVDTAPSGIGEFSLGIIEISEPLAVAITNGVSDWEIGLDSGSLIEGNAAGGSVPSPRLVEESEVSVGALAPLATITGEEDRKKPGKELLQRG